MTGKNWRSLTQKLEVLQPILKLVKLITISSEGTSFQRLIGEQENKKAIQQNVSFEVLISN